MSRAVAFTAFVLVSCGAVVAFGACGKTANDRAELEGGAPPEGDAKTSGPFPGDAPGYDAWSSDAASYDASHPDGGPPPVVACGGPNQDGGECAAPASVCIDDHWMRYYGPGKCNDAGTCDFPYSDMECGFSEVPPDCYQGGCRIVIIR
jgi:hypothetical protein